MKLPWRKEKKQNRRVSQTQTQPVTVQRRVTPQLIGLSVIGITLLGVIYATWLKLMDPQTLPLRQVRLEAPFNKVTKEHLHQVVKSSVNGGFFTVDVEAITAAVTALPWVDQAEVRRVWPDTLHVTVTEQVAVARWGSSALVNARGDLFAATPETFPDGLIELDGPETMVSVMTQQFQHFIEVIQPTGLELQRVILTPRRSWELQLSAQLQIVLGRDATEQRLQRFVKFYDRLATGAQQVKRLDMRYTNGFAVQWRG